MHNMGPDGGPRWLLVACIALVALHILSIMMLTTAYIDTLGVATLVSAFCEGRANGCSDEVRSALSAFANGDRNGIRKYAIIQVCIESVTIVMLSSVALSSPLKKP